MGVDFFPCARCSESICDCGEYIRCNDECRRKWCTLDCAAEDGYDLEGDIEGDDDLGSCNFCRKEDAEDSELLKFIMKKYKLTRKKVVKMYFEKSHE